MRKFLKLFLILFVLAGCSPKENSGNLTISTDNGDVSYNVEEAISTEELEKGLMNRDTLAENAGMIFDLSHVNNKVAMWMKDTKIPLDMIFLNKNGEIFFIFENAVPMSEELIIAPEPATFVLELNGGTVQKHNIKVGDKVKHHLIDEYIAQMNEENTSVTEEDVVVEDENINSSEEDETAQQTDTADDSSVDDLDNIPDDGNSGEVVIEE